MRLKAGLCQMNIRWEDKAWNLEKARGFMEEAAKQGADILFFPEMSLTGFSMNTELTKEAAKELTIEAYGETVAEFQRLCARYGIGAGIGWVKAAGEKAENHYTILDIQGRVLEDFVKLHPFSSAGEDRYFKPGNRIAEFELSGFPSTVFICYDLRFPEVFQAASNRAELMIIPANWPKARSEHWKCLLRARAIENQAYVLGINCTGKVGELSYQGDSCVISPLGEVISAMGSEEGILYQEIEADGKKYRESFPVKEDRRTEFYKSIL